MENSTVTGLRSRSRSKTPFLRSNGDHENCDAEQDDLIFVKSGRKTPVKRSTPLKQMRESSTIIEEQESTGSTVAQRTRQSIRITQKIVKTSDYSSEESLDRLKGNEKEIYENEVNTRDELVSTSARRAASLVDLTFSPISSTRNVSADRSGRWDSPAHSVCSTDSSFAEQALADASVLLDRDRTREHLPSRLYRYAGEYWNKYPKTDYTYSRLSKDRVELAPGQVAVPNMSRRSLSHFRTYGPVTSADEVDLIKTSRLGRYKEIDTSDDEGVFTRAYHRRDERWLITRLVMSVITVITSVMTSFYNTLTGRHQRQAYTHPIRNSGPSVLSRMTSYVTTPFYWFYTMVKTTTTTTITKITKNTTRNSTTVKKYYTLGTSERRRWWPWLLLLLLLPVIGYGSYYAYENMEDFKQVNFSDIYIDLKEWSTYTPELPSLPAITLPSLPNITLPSYNITISDIKLPSMPNISDSLPELAKSYSQYKDAVQDRMGDVSDYMKVVASSCYQEMRRYWIGFVG